MKTKVIQVESHHPNWDHIAEAAKIVRQGGLVIFPTETVYGIAANALDATAMARLRAVKNRSDDKPFSVIISQKGVIANYTSCRDPKLYKLIDEYWPGPLTVVVPRDEKGHTVGVRMPDHEVALNLTREAHCTVAAPSANFEGDPAPTTCQEALKHLDGLVDLALDSGPVDLGESSSVVDFTQEEPTLLRDGPITQEDINKTVNRKHVLFVCTGNSCRSVMAEYLLRSALCGKDVKVESAGTTVLFPTTASGDTITVLNEVGVDAKRHHSRSINSMMLKKADLIFVMTRAHHMQVLDLVPSVESRLYMLKEFVQYSGGKEVSLDVPDPMGRSHLEYQQCRDLISEAVNRIVELL